MTTAKPRWIRTETSRDHDVWELREGDVLLAELERDRPTKWHGNGVSGKVTDMEGPVSWSTTLWDAQDNHTLHHLQTGITLAAAKAAVLNLIAAARAV